jgi:tetratricopeptide (TPR) repeat protein
VFTNPLARALIEQRQNLATSSTAQERSRVVRMLDALTLAPQVFYANQSGVYTAIRAARWGLADATHTDEVEHVQDLLWQTAIGLERGGLLSAAEELRRLQAMIAQALAQGAPQEVIDALLQRYQDAMQRYMQALADNPQAAEQGAPPPDAKVLSQNDLQTLLKAIQQLAQSGARGQAQQMLALLQNLLENLRLSDSGSGGTGGADNPQNKALSDAIKNLGDLMGKQRGLLDKTFKGRQGEKVDPKALQQEQGDIQKQLGDIMKGLGGQKPDDLGRAGNSMGQSGRELGSSDLNSSAVDQKNALDAMRGAANDLANKLMKQMGQDKQNGQEDPLGRTGNGTSFGNDVKVPSKSDLQRARDILMELRRRAAERGRPQQELDYIDRLLKEF